MSNNNFFEDKIVNLTASWSVNLIDDGGYKCSAGIAHNKTLAKLVCSLHKPNKQTILPHKAVRIFFDTTPISKIKNLGGKFGQTIADTFKIIHMGELAQISHKTLLQKYDDKTAHWLFNIAQGIDTEQVTAKLISKSIACCKNFSGITALTSSEMVEHWMNELASEMSERLEKDFKQNNRRAKQLVISFIHEVDKRSISSSRTQVLNSYDQKKIVQIGMNVINKFCLKKDNSYFIKYMGLSASNFEDVKKIRAITSFFHVGENSKKDINNLNKISEYEEDGSIYKQLTQELDENVEAMVYYDDSFKLKNEDLYNKTNEEEIISGSSKTLPSFFTKYFDSDNTDSEVSNDATEDKQANNNRKLNVNVIEELKSHKIENIKICEECGQTIAIENFISHQDYHLAIKLSEKESVNQNSEPTAMKSQDSLKCGKRKKVANNSTILTSFLQKVDDLTPTEICAECNRKIKVQEMSSHLDYHTAKKIHLELNPVQMPVKNIFSKKIKIGKSRTPSSNRSVSSFFKPI